MFDFDKNIVRVHFFYNEKILLLTFPKIAHSLCRELFLENKVDTTIDFNPTTLEITPTQDSTNKEYKEYFENVNSIWTNFLNKKEKRDLIILYRNPYEHLISGFMQDWFGGHSSSGTGRMAEPFISLFINSIKGYPQKKESFFKKYYNHGIDENLFLEYPEITNELVDVLLDYYLTNAKYTGSAHFTLWISIISSIYYSNKIDRKKIKFFDIYDNPIQVQLKNYIENIDDSNIKHKKQNSYAFKFVKKLIKNNQKYSSIINALLYSELQIYDKIKNNEL